ncbi:MAG: cyclic nucleotide-binding domain-containing protein [Methylocystis sp.]
MLRTGDALFQRGEISDGGYVLTVGSIALVRHDDGRFPLMIVRPPTLIGETALLAQSTRPAAAFPRKPTTTLKILRPLFH